MQIRHPLPLLAVVLIGCSDFGADNSGAVLITTDKHSYAPSETITFTLTNLGRPTAYIWHCNHRLGYWIQEQKAGVWQRVDERYMVCAAVYESGAQAILVGQPYTDTLTLRASGTYRLEMGVGWDRNTLFDHRIYSNTLAVR
jgi:hypothetical protein